MATNNKPSTLTPPPPAPLRQEQLNESYIYKRDGNNSINIITNRVPITPPPPAPKQ